VARFRYKGIGSDGGIVTGDLRARDRSGAESALKARGLVPISIDERRSGQFSAGFASVLPQRKKVSARDLLVATREISVLLSAGVPLDRALQLMVKLGQDGPMKKISQELYLDVTNGSALSDAMAARGQVFPAYYAAMVRAGEAGGALPAVFSRLFEMLEKRAVLSAKLQSALIYPAIILLLTAVSIAVLLVLVIPEFKPIFRGAGDDLPWTTEMIVRLSDFAVAYGTVTLAGLLVAGLLLARMRLTDAQKVARDRFFLSLPFIGQLVRTLETSRFCRMLGTLRTNGVALVEGVTIAAETLQNRMVAAGIRQTIDPLAHGEGLSTPLRRVNVMPELALHLIEVGEESGKLDEMLIQVADIFDVETDQKIQTALSLLVPLVTVFLGMIVAFVIGSILSAIIGSYNMAF